MSYKLKKGKFVDQTLLNLHKQSYQLLNSPSQQVRVVVQNVCGGFNTRSFDSKIDFNLPFK